MPHPDGSHRQLYCLESPESWFEDFGRGRLTGGEARVALDADFAAVVRAEGYHVFLTPEGHTGGCTRAARVPGGSRCGSCGGAGTLPFSYRIVARRGDVEGARFEPVAIALEVQVNVPCA